VVVWSLAGVGRLGGEEPVKGGVKKTEVEEVMAVEV
jgi:hypothetical protein